MPLSSFSPKGLGGKPPGPAKSFSGSLPTTVPASERPVAAADAAGETKPPLSPPRPPPAPARLHPVPRSLLCVREVGVSSRGPVVRVCVWSPRNRTPRGPAAAHSGSESGPEDAVRLDVCAWPVSPKLLPRVPEPAPGEGPQRASASAEVGQELPGPDGPRVAHDGGRPSSSRGGKEQEPLNPSGTSSRGPGPCSARLRAACVRGAVCAFCGTGPSRPSRQLDVCAAVRSIP